VGIVLGLELCGVSPIECLYFFKKLVCQSIEFFDNEILFRAKSGVVPRQHGFERFALSKHLVGICHFTTMNDSVENKEIAGPECCQMTLNLKSVDPSIREALDASFARCDLSSLLLAKEKQPRFPILWKRPRSSSSPAPDQRSA
jgi:hypothetical protein